MFKHHFDFFNRKKKPLIRAKRCLINAFGNLMRGGACKKEELLPISINNILSKARF